MGILFAVPTTVDRVDQACSYGDDYTGQVLGNDPAGRKHPVTTNRRHRSCAGGTRGRRAGLAGGWGGGRP